MINLISNILFIVAFIVFYFFIYRYRERLLKNYESELKEYDILLREQEKKCFQMLEELKAETKRLESLKNESIVNIVDAYENIILPTELVKDMTYNDFIDWLELLTKEDIIQAIKVFERYKLNNHVKVMRIYVNRL